MICFRFSSEVITLRVKEDVDVGSVVGKVTATDDDSGNNARVSYSFYEKSETFDIDPDTGKLDFVPFIDCKNPLYITRYPLINLNFVSIAYTSFFLLLLSIANN